MKHVVLLGLAVSVALGACSSTGPKPGGDQTAANEQIVDVTSPPGPDPSPTSTATTATASSLPSAPTEADLLNASLPGSVAGGCASPDRLTLIDGGVSGLASVNGQTWRFGVGVARRGGDGEPLLATRRPTGPGPSAVMIVSSSCEASGQIITSHLMLCDARTCETATLLAVDDVPFIATGVVTESPTDLRVSGDEVAVELSVCSGTTGCATETQRYRWSADAVTRVR